MIPRTQHRLRCLMALGYSVGWISEQTGLPIHVLSRYHRTGTPELPEGTFDAVYALSRERRATPEMTGRCNTEICRARLRAKEYGYLPPMAYEQDDDGNDVLADPEAVVGVPIDGKRTPDRVCQDRLDLLRLFLNVPDRAADELAESIGIKNWDREIYPIRSSHLRIADRHLLADRRGWVNETFNRALLDLIARADIGECPVEMWQGCLDLFEATFGTPVPEQAAGQADHAQAA